MMKTNDQKFILTTLAAAILAGVGTKAAAADEQKPGGLDFSGSSVSVGVGTWNGDRERLGAYDGERDNGGVVLFDADISGRDYETGSWLRGQIRDLGLDSREADLEYERQGDWGIGVQYDEIRRFAPYTVNTSNTGLGTDNQTVAASNPAGRNYTLETGRKNAGVNVNKYLMPGLNFRLSYNREEKEGSQHWGIDTGVVSFLAMPIDATVRQVDTALDFTGKRFQLSGGYNGSWYENRYNQVNVAGNLLSLPQDNEAHQFYVNGGFNFTPTTRGTLRVSYTHATQDQNPVTTAAMLAGGAPTTFDGEVNTTLVYLGLNAQPMPELSLNANLRYHDVDEQTSPVALPFINSFGNGQLRHVNPHDYETISGKLEGIYRLPQGYNLSATVERKNQDRSIPFGSDANANGVDDERHTPYRAELDEDSYQLKLRKSMSETVTGAVAYQRSDRDGSSYTRDVDQSVSFSPVNIADRVRDKWQLSLNWVPADSLGFQLVFEDAQDDYGPDSNTYGLKSGDYRMVSLDADYAISKDWRLNAWASWDRNKATQTNFYDGAAGNNTTRDLNRTADLKDSGTAVGLGIDGMATAKLKVGADLEWSRAKSKFADSTPASYYVFEGLVPLESITSTTAKFQLFAEYELEKNSELRFDLIHERWKTDDWTWQFSDGTPFVYGGGGDGTIVRTDPTQSATFAGVRYKYKF